MQIGAFAWFKENNLVIWKGLLRMAERTQATGSGVAFPCVRHREHNENAAECDGRGQVGRNGDGLNIESI